ncbi:MAG: DUF6273 domain-containing protein [Treponema sp.]|nr:DUF6273 domain-containing protein [Treponema sp.]
MKTIITRYVAGFAVMITAVIGIMGCKGSDYEPHVHTYTEIWEYDEHQHWHPTKCGCTDRKDCDGHTFDGWTIIREATEEEVGIQEIDCSICDYKRINTIPKLNHIHSKGTHHNAVAGTCITNGTLEYYDCVKETCDVKLNADGYQLYSIDDGLAPANHEGTSTTWTKTATTHKETYNCCGAVKTSESVHTWNEGVVIKDATDYEKGEKTYECLECEKIVTKVIVIWYETPVDADTLQAATLNSKNVLFGVFPQTIKSSDVVVDKTDSIKMGRNTYYKGSDGEYYFEKKAEPYDSSYIYSDGTPITKTVAYFKVEPIKWKVVTTNYNGTNKVLLLAEDILTTRAVYSPFSDRNIDGKIIRANNYKYSFIHSYLNGDYYNAAFTSSAQSKIEITVIDNSAESTTDEEMTWKPARFCCDDTEDKIFILSVKEATATDYGFASIYNHEPENTRIRLPTDFAKANNIAISTSTYGSSWWLRSPAFDSTMDACYVNDDGSISQYGVVSNYKGIVPALTISLQ